jgi:mannitol-specific phosphotransferase system IIBC component
MCFPSRKLIAFTHAGDLFQIEEFTRSYSAVREMQQVENTLASLENKLRELKEILPIVDVRRGSINLGGRILKTLFGTATVTDIEDLHNSVSKLHDSEKAIVHSVNQHVTYIKQLDESVKFNAQATANLSTMMKVAAIGLNNRTSKLVSELGSIIP